MSAQLTTDPQGTSAASTSPLHNSPQDYLKRILNARVYDVAIESHLEPARALSRRLGNTVLLKDRKSTRLNSSHH